MAATLTINTIANLKAIQHATTELRKFSTVATETSRNLSKMLGGKYVDLKGFGQNLSALGNRLGFMAFQWKFMANAAQQAFQTIEGGLQNIIMEGAETSDSLTRALMFSTSIEDLRNMTDAGKKDLESMRDAIYDLGSGKTLFNIGQVSSIAMQLQKAFDDPQATKNILTFATSLKTIEPTLSDEKLGTGLVSFFESMGTNTKDIASIGRDLDFLASVANKSTKTIEGTIASLAVSMQQAKQIGLDVTDVGAAVILVSDVLARNKGGGREAATAGQYVNAMVSDLQRLTDIKTKQGKGGAMFGLDIFEPNQAGKPIFRDFNLIIDEFRKKLSSMSTGERANFWSQMGFGINSRETIEAFLTKTNEELLTLKGTLRERGGLEILNKAAMTSGLSQIKRIQSAVETFKATIAQGFFPALKNIADIFEEIGKDKEFRELLSEIGDVLAKEVIPIIRYAANLIRGWFNLLKKNRKTIELLVKGVVLLVAALGGLMILSQVAFFALVAAASMTTLTAQTSLTAGALIGLRAGIAATMRFALPLVVIFFGISMVALSLTGILDDHLAPAIAAIGIAIAALGASTMLFGLKSTLTGVLSIVGSIGSALVGLVKTDVAGKITAGMVGLEGGFAKSTSSILPNWLKTIGSLASAHPIAAAVVAAIAIGSAIGIALHESVVKSELFKTGLVPYWDLMGFKLKAAVINTLHAIGVFFRDAFIGIGDMINGFVGKIMHSFSELLIAIESGRWGDAAKAAMNMIRDLDPAVWFADMVAGAMDPLGAAMKELEKYRDFLRAGGKTNSEIIPYMKELLKDFEPSTGVLTELDVENIMRTLLGTSFDPTGVQDRPTVNPDQDFTAPQDDVLNAWKNAKIAIDGQTLQTDILTEQGGILYKSVNGVTTAYSKATGKIIDLTKGIVDNTGGIVIMNDKESVAAQALGGNIDATKWNTIITDSDSNTVTRAINLLDLNIIEMAINTNAIGLFTVRVEQAALAFLKLAVEGTEAARRLSSMQVNKKGEFSIQKRNTTTDFSEITGLSIEVEKQAKVVIAAFTRALAHQINIADLEKMLKEAEVALTKSNVTGVAGDASGASTAVTHEAETMTKTISSTAAGYLATLGDLDAFAKSNINYKRPGSFAFDPINNNKDLQIDLNIDGNFDITITQNLSADEVAELVRKKVTDELTQTNILKALKVTS